VSLSRAKINAAAALQCVEGSGPDPRALLGFPKPDRPPSARLRWHEAQRPLMLEHSLLQVIVTRRGAGQASPVREAALARTQLRLGLGTAGVRRA
jgi:hypothetical protein